MLIGAGIAAAISGLIVAIAVRRTELLRDARDTLRSMIRLLRQPHRAPLLLGGQLGVNLAYIAALGFALHAFGQDVPPGRLAAA
ncbi:hypothetical protein ABZV91_07580 [Nocardia sp. NPDC004568]|uniref:hypothetical protein n=1 Tax=Nocardia sp. NPDC004568 TaxID=3154551 RepID=UPI0033AE5EE0